MDVPNKIIESPMMKKIVFFLHSTSMCLNHPSIIMLVVMWNLFCFGWGGWSIYLCSGYCGLIYGLQVWYILVYTVSIHMVWSSPRCLLQSHYMVHSENNSYFVWIGPIRDLELTCIFWPVLFVYTLYWR